MCMSTPLRLWMKMENWSSSLSSIPKCVRMSLSLASLSSFVKWEPVLILPQRTLRAIPYSSQVRAIIPILKD